MLEDRITETEIPSILESAETIMILEAWGSILQALDQFANQAAKDCFYSIRVKIIIRVIHHLYKENKVSLYDEKIYESFMLVMKQYKEFIKKYRENQELIQCGKSKEILHGISEVLFSEVVQFEENKKSMINPVKHEKDQLISQTKSQLLQRLKLTEEEYKERRIENLQEVTREVFLFGTGGRDEKHYFEQVEFIYGDIIQNAGKDLYDHYVEEVLRGIERLNNFHLRQTANFYYEALIHQINNLESMIKIQVQALEQEILVGEFEEEQKEMVQSFLSIIRETYQYLGKEVEGFDKLFKELDYEQKDVVVTLEAFIQYLKEEGLEKYLDDLKKNFHKTNYHVLDFYHEVYGVFQNKWNCFIQFLGKEMSRSLVEKEAAVFAEIQRQQSFQEALVMKVIQAFQGFQKYYEANKEQLEKTEVFEIIQGIYETINIKIDSLEENTQYSFKVSKENANIDGLHYEVFNDKELDEISEKIYGLWNQYTGRIMDFEPSMDGKEFLKIILEKEKKEGIFFTIDMKHGRKLQGYQDQQTKRIYQFLKECLLFEMSTYEEILFYSVSKLRERTDDKIIGEYINQIDQLTEQLQTLLMRNDFELIQPKEHDLFDGKQHEVLMAEKQEGFEKGEIIKLMNTGYRYNHQVILRANVIAAK